MEITRELLQSLRTQYVDTANANLGAAQAIEQLLGLLEKKEDDAIPAEKLFEAIKQAGGEAVGVDLPKEENDALTS